VEIEDDEAVTMACLAWRGAARNGGEASWPELGLVWSLQNREEEERRHTREERIGTREERERGPPGRLLVQEGGEQEVAGAGTATQVPAWAPRRRQRPHLSNTPLVLHIFPENFKTGTIPIVFCYLVTF
jgi:hypothetical protein